MVSGSRSLNHMFLKLRNSWVQVWKDCRRKFMYAHMKGLSTGRISDNLVLGTAVHAGIATLYERKTGHDPMVPSSAQNHALVAEESVIQAFKARSTSLTAQQLENVDELAVTARAMVAGYAHHYGSQDKDVRPVGIEKQFEIKLNRNLPKSHVLRGTIDMLAEWNGDLYIFEHKTTSDVSQDYFDRASVDWQVHGYSLAAFVLTGKWPKGIVYNAIRKPSIRQTKKEGRLEYLSRLTNDYIERPGFYFARQIITLSQVQLSAYMSELRFVFDEIAEAVVEAEKGNKEYLYSNSGNCMKYNQRCEFLDACAAYREPDHHSFSRNSENIITYV